MPAITGLLIPIIIVILVALIIIWIAERFSPDPLITRIVQAVVFVLVLVFVILKLAPLLHAQPFDHCRWRGDPPTITCEV